MNKTLTPNQSLQALAEHLVAARWSCANQIVMGSMDERKIRLRCFKSGLTAAISTEIPVASAAKMSLLLATMEQAGDDALYIENNQVWLLRRYPEKLTEVELDLLFKQQMTMVALLAPRQNTKPSVSFTTGRYA